MHWQVLQRAACGSMQPSHRLFNTPTHALRSRSIIRSYVFRDFSIRTPAKVSLVSQHGTYMLRMPLLDARGCNGPARQYGLPSVIVRHVSTTGFRSVDDIRTGHAHGLIEEENKWHLDVVVRYDSSKPTSPAAPSPLVHTGEDAYVITGLSHSSNDGNDMHADGDTHRDNSSNPSSHTLLAVADGVGGWQNQGVDPSLFAWELMKKCAYVACASSDLRVPLDILTHAYRKVLHDRIVKAGSSTATISMFDRNTGVFSVANLGDSYACVIRGEDFVLETQEQQHYFNAPYQLAVIPGAEMDSAVYETQDSPSAAASTSVATRDGDIILLATDGYSDNVFPRTTAAICSLYATVKAPSTGAPTRVPQTIGIIADQLLDACLARAQSATADTPFARHAAEAGMSYTGGKPDDVTFIVARVRAPRPPKEDRKQRDSGKRLDNDKHSASTTTSTDNTGGILAHDPTKRRFVNDMPLLCNTAAGCDADDTVGDDAMPFPVQCLLPLAHL